MPMTAGMTGKNLGRLVEKMRDMGMRATPQRREIVRVLAESGRHLTARQVHAKMRVKFPDVSHDTVYRNLRTLALMGLACQSHLQTGRASRFALVPNHHHHMICIECGHTVDLPGCPLTDYLADMTAAHDFEATGHLFEVYGRCTRCRHGGTGEGGAGREGAAGGGPGREQR